MKILHMVNTYAPIGGVETYVLELLPQLAMLGHENALIYRHQHPRTPVITDRSIYHVPVSTDTGQDRQRVAEIMEKERPSVIYLHDVYDPEFVLLAAQAAPSVGYVHSFYPVCPGQGKLFRRSDQICTRAYGPGCVPMIYLRRCASARHPRSVVRIMQTTKRYLGAYRQLSRVIVASGYMKDLMIQNGMSADRIDVLPYFVPIPETADLAEPQPDSWKPGIMFAGRLEYEKGVPYLLLALTKMKTPHPLLIAGDGSLRTQYMQLARELKVDGRVQFTPWLSVDDLQAAYRRHAVIVMPTIMAEPFGKVGVEAMANGRPVVAFNVGGIPDWLIDGQNGYLVPARDVDQLAARLDLLLRDPERANRMGRNGRQYVLQNYTYDNHLSRLMSILEQVAATNP